MVVITDNGAGGITEKANSYGLTGVKERLIQIGAQLQSESNSTGTKMVLEL